MELVKRGAEADVFVGEYFNKKSAFKVRKAKKYRIKEIDEKLRTERTRSECRILALARKSGINCPVVYDIDMLENSFVMSWIDGEPVDNVMNAEICRKIGSALASLHKADIIHNDLTPINILFREGSIYFIDFGLSYISKETEDKAMDLVVLKKAMLSQHAESFGKLWKELIKEYSKNDNEGVVKQMKEIEKRGRYVCKK